MHSQLLPKKAWQEHINLDIAFIAQNVSTTTLQCHYDDGWGPSTKDPAGIEGLQDCLLDRYNLCSKALSKDWRWFDYVACTYKNQKSTDTITDGGKLFNQTVESCASDAQIPFDALSNCAHGSQGAALLTSSHVTDVKDNPNVDSRGHHHPTWILVNGKAVKDSSSWLHEICTAIDQPDIPCNNID